MIDNLRDLNDKINAFVDFVVRTACERTTSGNYFVQAEDAMKFAGMSYEDFLEYRDLIFGELQERTEVLDFEFEDSGMEFDVNCGLDYCPHYEWCDGDEATFGCSYDEWLERPVLPVGQKAPEPVFYVGDGIYTDKQFSDFESARSAFEMLTKHRLDDVTLGVVLPGKGAHVLLYSFNGLEQDMIGAPELKKLGLAEEVENALEEMREAMCPKNDLMVGKWRVHIVAPGDRYGLNNCLINDKKNSLLEFWDMSVSKDKFPEGQFTWRYHVDSLFEDRYGISPEVLMRHGLHLDLAVPSWTVSGDEMTRVFEWLKKKNLLPGEHYFEVTGERGFPSWSLVDEMKYHGMEPAEAVVVHVHRTLGQLSFVKNLNVEYVATRGELHCCTISFTSQADEKTIKKELINENSWNIHIAEKVVEAEREPLDQVIGSCEGMNRKNTEKGISSREER